LIYERFSNYFSDSLSKYDSKCLAANGGKPLNTAASVISCLFHRYIVELKWFNIFPVPGEGGKFEFRIYEHDVTISKNEGSVFKIPASCSEIYG
jgi:hypothetical protein